MGVFKKSGCTCLRTSRLNAVGGSLELMKSIPNLKDIIITRQNADRPIQEVIEEAIAEITEIIDAKCTNPEHAEALKNGTGFWFSNPDSPPEVELSEDSSEDEKKAAEKQKKEVYEKELKELLQAVSVEVEMAADEPRELLKTLSNETKNVDPAILPLLGAAFESGRCVERGIACLLHPDVKRGKQFNPAKYSEIRIETYKAQKAKGKKPMEIYRYIARKENPDKKWSEIKNEMNNIKQWFYDKRQKKIK